MERTNVVKIIKYDIKKFDFGEIVSDMIAEEDLTNLNGLGIDIFKRENDQQTIWHKRFYDNIEELVPLYKDFVHDVAAIEFSELIHFQKVPNLRIQLPNNIAVGEFHCDGWYGHPQGEINFWLPLTPTEKTSTIQIEKSGDIVAVVLEPGEALMFDAVNTYHGNIINKTSKSRVSLDFRVIPNSKIPLHPAKTINSRMTFAPGDFYSGEAI